jgi:hypothetical protein
MRKTTTNGRFFPLHEKINKCSRKATASSPRENTKGLQANPSSTTHVTTLHKLSLSLSLSLSLNSEFSVTITRPHESFSKCRNPTK